MPSRKLLAAIALSSALALTACSSSGSNPQQSGGSGNSSPFEVLAVLSLTGSIASAAQGQLDAMNAAITDINSNGGIDGRQVHLTVADDGLDPTKAVTLVQENLDKAKPDFVYSGSTSNSALAMLPLLSRNDVLAVDALLSAKLNDPKQFPYFFSLHAPSTLESDAMAAQLKTDGAKSVALLMANDASGQSYSAAYSDALKAAGIQVSAESYDPAGLDMTGQLERLKADNPDDLIIQGFGAAVGHVLSSRTKIGWDVKTYGSTSIGEGNNLGAISQPSDWTNFELLVPKVMTPDGPSVGGAQMTAMMAGLKAENSKLDQPMTQYSTPWDILHLVKYAVEKAGGSTSGKDLSAVLENLGSAQSDPSFTMTYPTVTFTADNHFLTLTPEQAYGFVPAGPLVNGAIVPQQ